jgi:glycosyltransferase involved in cell wall biosynthesis
MPIPGSSFFSSPIQGIATALNHALRFARGEYVARQDADDISLPQRLVKQVESLEAHREVEWSARRLR